MKFHRIPPAVFALAFFLSLPDLSLAQTPPVTLRLTAKVRDFAELPNSSNPCSGANCPSHPDFNTAIGDCKNAVDVLIDTNGTVNTNVFPFDNRNPRYNSPSCGVFSTTQNFNDWYNDRITDALPHQNRPFLYDMVFTRNASGQYEYINSSFFPIDNDSITAGRARPIPGVTASFGHLNTGNDTRIHNYGFTTEFHATFTYFAADATHPAQVFNFTGDDDVWVFINGRRVIDLGGVHAAEDASVTLDAATAATLGLQNGFTYMLDFFLAERHTVASNCRITTSLQLDQRVATPVANPAGTNFTSQLSVQLSTPTPNAVIYYTTDGSIPDSTKTKYDPAMPVVITSTTTVKAIAMRPGWRSSDIMTEVYTKTFVASTLEILDQNGNPLPGYLSELNNPYTIKVTTTQAGLTSITARASTQTALDSESVVIANPTALGDNFVFSGTEPLVIGAAAAANGKTEASAYDSLIVRWVNPADPARDIAEKRILVRPAPKQARVYFSTSATGTPETDTYAGTETSIYVFVTDEILPTGSNPTIALVTTTPSGSGRLGETETLNLTPVSPGLYRATVPVQVVVTPIQSDNTLQLQVGDLIKATYVDPLDKDSASANAGFGVQPEIDGKLSFTDKDGNILPNGIHYSPAEGTLYLQYSDDFILAQNTVTATLTITNRKGTASPDQETLTLTLNLAKKNGSTGIWEGSIPLADGPAIVKNNGTAETYVLGEVHAEATSHDKSGAPLTQVSDDLLVAYPNQGAEITIEGSGGPNVPIKRTDTGITVTITDQSLSTAKDTLYFNVSCSGSHDGLVNIMAVETAANSGIYQSSVISKAEGAANASDAKLECLSHDFVRVSYTDPVYDSIKNVEREINEPMQPRVSFSSDPAGANPITVVSDADADSFYVVVTARNADINVADTVPVTLSIAGGESETFKAVETGTATNTFIVKVPFKFVTGSATANQILEGKITASNTSGLVTATGKVNVDGIEATGSIDLRAAYDKVQKAYIKDTDGDGKGDKVYIVFVNRLPRVPDQITARWNSDKLPGKTADKPKISFLDADSNTVVADYTANEFGAGLTAIDPLSPPTATLPNDALFKGQQPNIEDSIGPIILTAVKHPVNPNLVGKGDPNLNKDTIIAVLSEPLKDADLRNILKFSSSCSDYTSARVITSSTQPTYDPATNTYTIIVDNNTGLNPTANKDCIFLNGDGAYTDNDNNLPPHAGVKLQGNDGKKIIQLFRGYPPVAGFDPNNANYKVSVQDNYDGDNGGYAQETSIGSGTYAVYWFPPYGFNPSNPSDFKPYRASITDTSMGPKESIEAVEIPRNVNLSLVQVVSKEPYIAHVTIFDNLGNFLHSSVQAFGFRGELENDNRIVPKGRVSFLVWDQRDTHGQLAANGVYVWKVVFQFKGGKQEVQYTRTGIMRK